MSVNRKQYKKPKAVKLQDSTPIKHFACSLCKKTFLEMYLIKESKNYYCHNCYLTKILWNLGNFKIENKRNSDRLSNGNNTHPISSTGTKKNNSSEQKERIGNPRQDSRVSTRNSWLSGESNPRILDSIITRR